MNTRPLYHMTTQRSKTTIRRTTADSVYISDWSDIPGEITNGGQAYLFPSIKSTSKMGKTTEWLMTIRIYPTLEIAQADPRESLPITPDIAANRDKTTPHVARLRVVYRLGDGAIQRKVPTFVTEGKNMGQRDETNVFCQALRDAYGLYNKQRRRACTDSTPADTPAIASDGAALPRPMLAKLYYEIYGDGDRPSPLFVQRKYNGVRAIGTLAADGAILYSRKGLLYEGFTALKSEIARICDAWRAGTLFSTADLGIHQSGALYLDGELYKHEMPLQVISGIVRRPNDDAKQSELQFVVYDVFVVNKGNCVSNALNFDERFAIMRAIQRSDIGARLKVINFAETFSCVNRAPQIYAIDRVKELYEQFLAEHFEGAIVRINAPYEHGAHDRHANVLLKIKPVRDAEFKIVGYDKGKKGRALGALLFICATADGIQFNVTPTGTIAGRIEQASEFARFESNGKTVFINGWLGKMLIVFFDELSPTGVPQRARTHGTIRICD